MKKKSDLLKNKKAKVSFVFLLILFVFIGCGYLYFKKRNDNKYYGTISASEIAVMSLDSGKIQKIAINECDIVKENDLLIQLDAGLMDNKIKQIQAEIEYEKAKENLLKLKENTSLEEYLNCKKNKNQDSEVVNSKLKLLESIQSSHNLQLKKIVMLEAELSYYNEKKKNLFICSPCNGKIQNLFANKNQNVKSGEKLLTVLPTDRVWLTAKMPIAKYKIGDDFNIFIENYPGSKFKGKIFSVSNSNKNKSFGCVDVKLSVNQIKTRPNEAVLPLAGGMKACIKHE